MQHVLSESIGWSLLTGYGLVMASIVWLFTRRESTAEQHLVANRQVGVWPGAFSIAATWIWAPAIFVCSQKSYEQGLAGIFWFTVPNILCFFLFVPIVCRARAIMPNSYSLPDFILTRFSNDKRPHLAFLLLVMGTSLTGIISNSLAGGLLLHSLAGTSLQQTIIAFSSIALFYSAWRGLPASVVTDVIQMSLILVIAFLLVPWTISEAGGLNSVWSGLRGIEGSTNIMDPWILYSFGIPATITLMCGPLCDQMFYQRAMATSPQNIGKTFRYGGLIFGTVPIVLSLFGFIAASSSVHPIISVVDPQLVSVAVVQHFLPYWTLFGFAIMALCGLSSTLDSAYCAAGSLISVDVYRRYIRPAASDQEVLWASKVGMLVIAIAGTAIALVPGLNLLWVFLTYGILSASGFFPAVLTIYWSKATANGAFLGVLVSFGISLPLSIYANMVSSAHLTVLASLIPCVLGTVVTIAVSKYDQHRSKFLSNLPDVL